MTLLGIITLAVLAVLVALPFVLRWAGTRNSKTPAPLLGVVLPKDDDDA